MSFIGHSVTKPVFFLLLLLYVPRPNVRPACVTQITASAVDDGLRGTGPPACRGRRARDRRGTRRLPARLGPDDRQFHADRRTSNRVSTTTTTTTSSRRRRVPGNSPAPPKADGQ